MFVMKIKQASSFKRSRCIVSDRGTDKLIMTIRLDDSRNINEIISRIERAIY